MAEQLAAPAWTCARCEVTVRWMAEVERPPLPPLPPNWAEQDGQLYCLLCRRELAAEAGLADLPEGAPAAQRQQRMSHARIEFEVLRDPGRANNKIAKSCRTSIVAVQRARERLGLPHPPRA